MATATKTAPSRTRLGPNKAPASRNKTHTRIERVQSARNWLQRPFGRIRDEAALRVDLAREVGGLFRDVGVAATGPIRRKRQQRGEIGKPATKRDARRHAQFKQQRQAEAPPPARPATPAPVHRTSATATERSSSPVSDVVQQLIRAANHLGEVDIEHADEFDEITHAMSKAMTMVGDAFDQFADTCDELKLAPKITQHLHEAAGNAADLGEHYKTARKVFRSEYEEYLNPSDRMPDPQFFQQPPAA